MKAAKKRFTGPPEEVFVYRVLLGAKGRGGRRVLFENVVPGREIEAANRAGPGLIRLEYRDRHRWVTHVLQLWIGRDGSSLVGARVRAPKKRKVPPPTGR